MAGLSFTLTDVGRAALVNAQNTGVNALTISQIGVSAVHTAGALTGLAALPNELKRLNTFGGDVVADDTLHLTIRDESADSYSLRAFGLYLSNGVLFGVYSQAGVILEKSEAAMLLLATDVVLASLTTAMIEFGSTDFINPPATSDTPGVVELADQAEVDAGVRNDVAVTPGRLKVLLLTMLGGKADTGHTHDAGAVVSGVFSILRIPDLAMAKITGLVAALAGKSDSGHTHAAGDVTSGTFNVLRIPDLAIAKITDLAAALGGKSDTGHTHDAAAVITGVFNALRIPDLAMAKITDLAAALALKLDVSAFTWNTIPGRPAVAITDTDAIFNSVQVKQSSAPVMGRIYLGDQTGGTRQLLYTGEAYDLPGAPLYADGGRVWTATTFDPATKATLGADAAFRDLAATRGDGSGFLYLGGVVGSPRSLAYSAGAYALAGAPLDVNGGRVWTALTLDPTPATAGQFRSNTGVQPLNASSVWAAAQIVAVAQVATLTLDLSAGLNFSTTMTGNRTLGAPSNAKPGQSGFMTITQDATGGRTLTFDAAWKFSNGLKPSLSAAPGARDILAFTVVAAGDVVASLLKDVK